VTPRRAAAEGGSARRGALAGLWAGLWLGALEGVERSAALEAHLAGPGEMAALVFLALAPVALLATLVGWLAGTVVGLARVALSPAVLPSRAGRFALGGAALGLAAGLWLLFAFTLTARLGAWLRWAPFLAAGAVACGALLGAAVSRLPAPPRALALTGLGGLVLALHFVNSRFAPQSSYGIHVLLDTGEMAAAWLAALLYVRSVSRQAGFAVLALVVALAAALDVGWRTAPQIEALVKVRGVVSRRAMDAISRSLDWDGDGFAPVRVAGGFDDAPFDPDQPPAILRCPQGAAGAEEPASAEDSAGAPAARGPRAAKAAGRRAERSHLLLFTVDALRHDVVPGSQAPHPLGDDAPTLANLSGLAARAARFEVCYAHASGTEDSFGSLFAGRYHPGLLCGTPWEEYLPARLAAAGYRVGAWVNRSPMPERAWGWERIDVRDGETERQIDAVLDFLAGPAGTPPAPAFAWLHLMDLHASTLKPWSAQAYDARAQRARYRRGLLAVDRMAGLLLSGLEVRGLAASTLLVLTADHGEELGEHGHYHHNLSLYEPAVRVPLWVAGPGVVLGRRDGEVTHLDLHATLLEWAGLEGGGLGGQGLGARSLAGVLAGQAPPAPDGVYLFLPVRGFSRSLLPIRLEHGQAAWVDAASGRKAILRFDRGTEEYYDLRRDPGERWNQAGAPEPWVDSLRQEVWRAVRRNGGS
jgi:arylsulfatase A-like enzyme